LNLLLEELEAEPRTVAQTASTSSQQQSKVCLRCLPASCRETACPEVTALPRVSYLADGLWAEVPATPRWASHHSPGPFWGDYLISSFVISPYHWP